MTYTKRTLRRMPPVSRRFAVRLNELELATRALKRLLAGFVEYEQLGRALERDERARYAARLGPGGDLFDPETEAAARALRGDE